MEIGFMLQDVESWIEKAQRGSKSAFNKLVKKYTAPIFRLLYDMTGNYQDSQDLAQETFLRAYLKIKQYRGEAKFTTWLYRIAHNIAIDYLRGRRTVSVQGNEQWIESQKAGRDEKEYTGESELLEKALKTLVPSQRSAVVLHYYHGMKMKEIGDLLGCSEATARVHLFRGLNHLRVILKDQFSGEMK